MHVDSGATKLAACLTPTYTGPKVLLYIVSCRAHKISASPTFREVWFREKKTRIKAEIK